MNKEEIEELKDFTIDITDIDELALDLEVCSKKSNMVIQEFANTIIQLEQQCKKQKEVIDKTIEYIKEHIKYECDAAYNGMQFYSYHLYDFDKQELLDISKEVLE